MASTSFKVVPALMLTLSLLVSTGAAAEPTRVVALGDSNTAGLWVAERNAFPALIEKTLREAGYDVVIANEGISGDTSAGMLSRLDEAVPRGTSVVIVQGGYNDKRRGILAAGRDANIEAILSRLDRRGVKSILCGLSGAQWSALAKRHNAQFVPGSTCYDVDNRGFDRLHMNRAGHRVVASRLAPVVQRLLDRR